MIRPPHRNIVRSAAAPASAACTSYIEPYAGANGLPDGTVGEVYSVQVGVQDAGGCGDTFTPPFSFGVYDGKLPVGLSMSSSGAIRGVPVEPQDTRFLVEVVDSSPQHLRGALEMGINVASTDPGLDDLLSTLEADLSQYVDAAQSVADLVLCRLEGKPNPPDC